MPEVKDWLTLIAAMAAAILALIGVILNVRSANALPQREALRRLLEVELNNVGGCIYYIISLSQKMVRAKNQNSFDNFRKLSEHQRRELNKLRSKLRYSLWGLDDGFLAIRSIPMYITHYKNTRPDRRADNIIRIGTKLRYALDRAILQAYISGLPPSITSRWYVRFWAWRLHRCFEKGRRRRVPGSG